MKIIDGIARSVSHPLRVTRIDRVLIALILSCFLGLLAVGAIAALGW